MPFTDVLSRIKKAKQAEPVHLFGVDEPFEAYFAAKLWQKLKRPLLLVVQNHSTLEHVAEELTYVLGSSAHVLTFPAWDTQPYDRIAPDKELQAARLQAAAALKHGFEGVVITTVNALSVKLPPAGLLPVPLVVKEGQTLPRDEVIATLERFGYLRVGTVMEPGEYAVRGAIVDVFPPTEELPYRIDYFDDEVESLRRFDPASQRTESAHKTLSIQPAAEMVLSEPLVATFRKNYRRHFPEGMNDPLYRDVSENRNNELISHYLPLFYDTPMQSFMELFPANGVVVVNAAFESAVQGRCDNVREAFESRVQLLEEGQRYAAEDIYRPIPPEGLYVSPQEFEQAFASHTLLHLARFDDGKGTMIDAGLKPVQLPPQLPEHSLNFRVAEKIKAARSQGHSVLVSALSLSALEKMERGLEVEGITPLNSAKTLAEVLKQPAVYKAVTPVGWGVEDAEQKLLLITEQDVFGERQNRPKKRKRSNADVISHFSQLSAGGFVVHADHGIGRFEGMETLEIDGNKQDFVKLVYDGGDKLFVPVVNLDVLSRYSGAEGDAVRLDKLGSAAWQARKAKVKEDLLAMAGELIDIAAERATHSGYQFKEPDGFYDEFCSGFPYVMTPEQQSTMDEVIADMCSPRPMDRLVVGDVGFGKTEIALRAAFIAAASGKQVAVVAPTTLLAKQHYDQFKKRFGHFPVGVGHLSRLASSTEARKTREGLKNGTVDIVVGTHAVLAESVVFKDLGLLVIDEEQRFGVRHKEKLKELKANVDVMTLTATPIPRTMQMAVSGMKTLSTITTPPVDRLAVRTYVMPYDAKVMREAVLRELFRRGQVFIVTPRVDGIEKLTERFRQLVPEAKIKFAHGQMGKDELDSIMTEFYEGQFDVLVATTIIESGIDVPRANTMIVHNAHMFGLAQLYQLRGRVGRSKVRAYAYLLLPKRGQMTEDATKRLQLLQRLEGVGSGFMLASYDLDTRGAGNILGKEQSGQIREVGFELYNEMLKEAIAQVKAGRKGKKVVEKNFTPVLNMGLSYLIPDDYVDDFNQRLQLYKRLSAMETQEDIEQFRDEVVDRFGPMPEALKALLEVVIVRNLCYKLNIARVEAGVKGAVFSLHNNTFPAPERLLQYIQRMVGVITLRPDQRLVLHRPLGEGIKRLQVVHTFLQELEQLVEKPKPIN